MSQGVIKIALAMAFAALLPSCFGAQVNTARPGGPVALAFNFPRPTPTGTPEPQPSLTVGQVAVAQGAVQVRGFHEPDIETVAKASSLNPNRGEFGADATRAINQYVNPVVVPAFGQPRYKAEHITALDEVKARIAQDIVDQQAIMTFGHGVPVIVQTMTKTMPGWNHWNATHMITIFAFDFSHNDPALDTVSYAETPSPLAGYRGPDFQTISVAALWVAMQAYIKEFPADPMNVIS
jgi:hypothetical protein